MTRPPATAALQRCAKTLEALADHLQDVDVDADGAASAAHNWDTLREASDIVTAQLTS